MSSAAALFRAGERLQTPIGPSSWTTGGALLKVHSGEAEIVLALLEYDMCRRDSFGQGLKHSNTENISFSLYNM